MYLLQIVLNFIIQLKHNEVLVQKPKLVLLQISNDVKTYFTGDHEKLCFKWFFLFSLLIYSLFPITGDYS